MFESKSKMPHKVKSGSRSFNNRWIIESASFESTVTI